jgi:predicted RNA binding protein YcfA (HicA-like mRNA interferase family)
LVPRRLGSLEIIAILESRGFTRVSQRGSHIKFRSADGRIVIVPAARKEIPIGTIRSIIRQSGLDRAAFGF